MIDSPNTSPGTVSKILWHFTGGPVWDAKRKRQQHKPKGAPKAYDNLKSILKSRELRLGGYKEIVRLTLPEVRRWDSTRREIVTQRNVPVVLESSPVCCLSDIPAPHLGYHASRYGKFALGFRRDAVIGAGFNPVFYTLEHTAIIRAIYEGLSSLESVDLGGISTAVYQIQSAADDALMEHDDLDLDVSLDVNYIEGEASAAENLVADARQSIADFVAFVKTFDQSEFASVYCEREWRSTHAYHFDINDVAMVVLPESAAGRKYFRPFVERVAPQMKLPRRIPVVAWEDLVEH